MSDTACRHPRVGLTERVGSDRSRCSAQALSWLNGDSEASPDAPRCLRLYKFTTRLRSSFSSLGTMPATTTIQAEGRIKPSYILTGVKLRIWTEDWKITVSRKDRPKYKFPRVEFPSVKENKINEESPFWAPSRKPTNPALPYNN